MTEGSRIRTKTLILVTVVVCLVVGGLLSYSVLSEPVPYIASMSHGIIFLFVLAPLTVILFCLSVAAAALQKTRYAVVFFIGCLGLPGSYFGFLKSAQALGLARYETSGMNEMRSVDEEPNGNIIVVYEKSSTFEEQEKLSRAIIHPWKEGPGFTGETGVQASIGLLDIDGRVAQKILFRASATETEKDKLRMGLQASPVVYRYFENLTESEVRKILETKKGGKKL